MGFIRGFALGGLLFAFGLGAIGCSDSGSPPPKDKGIENTKKMGEQMKKIQQDKKIGGAGTGGGQEDEKDKDKSKDKKDSE